MSEPSVDVKPEDLAERLGVSIEKLMSGVMTGRFDQMGESDIIRDDEGSPVFFRFPESRAYSIFGDDLDGLDEVATEPASTVEGGSPPSKAEVEERLAEILDAYRRGEVGADTCGHETSGVLCEAMRQGLIGKEKFVRLAERTSDDQLAITLSREGITFTERSTEPVLNDLP